MVASTYGSVDYEEFTKPFFNNDDGIIRKICFFDRKDRKIYKEYTNREGKKIKDEKEAKREKEIFSILSFIDVNLRNLKEQVLPFNNEQANIIKRHIDELQKYLEDKDEEFEIQKDENFTEFYKDIFDRLREYTDKSKRETT